RIDGMSTRPRVLDMIPRGGARSPRLRRRGSSRMREMGIGKPVPRTEDLLLLRGLGRYTDDIALPREARLYVLRSPHAAARIRGLDATAARGARGVLAVLTAAEMAAENFTGFPSRVQRHRPDGKPNFVPPYRPLAAGRVRHLGEPVAAIVAET